MLSNCITQFNDYTNTKDNWDTNIPFTNVFVIMHARKLSIEKKKLQHFGYTGTENVERLWL